MKDLSIKEFSDLIYKKLELLNYKQILSKPTTESTFPCLELHTPLKSVNKTENGVPVMSTFQISISCWNEDQGQAMQMTSEVDAKLQQYNIIRTGTNQAIYDDTLKKYCITAIYEVRYNSLTNAFIYIK